MSDAQLSYNLNYTAFITSNFDRLQANVRGQAEFTPVGELKTDQAEKAVIDLTTSADALSVQAQMATNPIPDIVWYLTHARLLFINDPPDAGFGGFFETNYTTSFGPIQGAASVSDYRSCSVDALSASTEVWDGNATNPANVIEAAPAMAGFPNELILNPDQSDFGALQQLLAFTFIVDTFDAGALAAMSCHLDVRYLGFPVSARRSGGFYRPRMSYRTGNSP